MEKKTTYKIFTIADYDEEAAYLRKMYKAGWQLAKVNLSPFLLAAKYTFEKCLPEDYSYQLDCALILSLDDYETSFVL